MIEEPEISLHPGAQVEMCRFLARSAVEGKQIIASTHSQFMLLALQAPIREGVISSQDVAIFDVTRNPDQSANDFGATQTERLSLEDEGFLSDWVPSFSDVEQGLARDWGGGSDNSEEDANDGANTNV
jgi:predicted ATPase